MNKEQLLKNKLLEIRFQLDNSNIDIVHWHLDHCIAFVNDMFISCKKGNIVTDRYPRLLNTAEKEKDSIIASLLLNNDKRSDTAKDLGMSERTLYRKIKKYNL